MLSLCDRKKINADEKSIRNIVQKCRVYNSFINSNDDDDGDDVDGDDVDDDDGDDDMMIKKYMYIVCSCEECHIQ